MGLIELVLALLIVILVLQLFFSFIPGLDQRVVTIIILLVVLMYFFGGHRGHWRW
jgi:hypothetical protein